MALTDLLQAIQADADAELAALERRLVAEAEAEAEAEAGRRLAAARQAAASRVRVARADGYLRLREQLAGELAAQRDSDNYPVLLGALIDEALATLTDATRLRVDPRDEEITARHLAGVAHAVALEATLETWGGAEALSDAGRRATNTLELRLANAEPQLRLAYSRLVAGGAP